MTYFSFGKTYVFTPRGDGKGNWGMTRQHRVKKLVYVGTCPAAIKAGLQMFLSAAAGWAETFTPQQISDFNIEAA